MNIYVITSLALSLVFIILGLIQIISVFRKYYQGIGYVIVISYLLFLLHVLLDILLFYSESVDRALNISKVSSAVLGSAFYLLHYFHDEISTEYRQRKTMTLASALLGVVIGGTLIDGSITIDEELNAPILSPYYGLVFVMQAILVIHRLTNHNLKMGELSEHYEIETSFTLSARIKLQKISYALAFLTLVSFIFFQNVISTPFTATITISLLLLSYLYRIDSLSSLPISQKLDAIALIEEGEVKFLHAFAPEGFHFAEGQDFGIFMTSIGKFFEQIIQSETRIQTISTQDTELVFEELDDGFLIMMMEDKIPLLQKILKATADDINRIKPQKLEQFTEIVTKQLIRLEI
ncbi:MAG: hypothetical protein IH840_13820 [Candidatus Heimdallarchaeota archaeon]|nr:hypothetical protein [Candidatus Heimdallarchaeota archaeon]